MIVYGLSYNELETRDMLLRSYKECLDGSNIKQKLVGCNWVMLDFR